MLTGNLSCCVLYFTFVCVCVCSDMCTQEGHTFVCRQKFQVMHNKIKDINVIFYCSVLVIQWTWYVHDVCVVMSILCLHSLTRKGFRLSPRISTCQDCPHISQHNFKYCLVLIYVKKNLKSDIETNHWKSKERYG